MAKKPSLSQEQIASNNNLKRVITAQKKNRKSNKASKAAQVTKTVIEEVL